MEERTLLASRALARLDLNAREEEIPLHHFWCRVAFQKYEQYNPKPHRHSFFELHLCLTGECVIEAFGKCHTLTPREFLLIPPQQVHTIHTQSEDFTKFVWGFSVEDPVISAELSKSAAVPRPHRVGDDFLQGIDILLENSTGTAFGSHPFILAELSQLFLLLVRILSPGLPATRFQKNRSTQLSEIQKYILDNLSSKLTVEDIASQFFLSRKQLVRLCADECHMSPHQLKQSLQAQKIRQLLAETDLSLEEIALESGFADKYAMSKFFHKSEGLPPARYRKSVRA